MKIRCEHADEHGGCQKPAIGAVWSEKQDGSRVLYRFCCREHMGWAVDVMDLEAIAEEDEPAVGWKYLEEVPEAALAAAPRLQPES